MTKSFMRSHNETFPTGFTGASRSRMISDLLTRRRLASRDGRFDSRGQRDHDGQARIGALLSQCCYDHCRRVWENLRFAGVGVERGGVTVHTFRIITV
jgi:hypothetical protein